MCTIINPSLLPAVKLGISSAVTVYKMHGSHSEKSSFQLKTKTKANQRLFTEAIALSDCGQLDYLKCIELMSKMKEGKSI